MHRAGKIHDGTVWRTGEYGIAAHWKYKLGMGAGGKNNSENEGGIVVPLTDDDFVKTGKLEGYSEMIQKLHEEEQTQPEITYDLQLDDDEDEEEK